MPSPSATAAPTPAPPPVLTSATLREAISTTPIRIHLEALQAIADAHGGNRAANSTGFDASVEYVAERLEAAGYAVQRLPFSDPRASGVNLVAEAPGRIQGEVVMIGAHLDSVAVGPGMNDNGSGSMTLLVLAEALSTFAPPGRTIRFAWWGAEELGEIGSSAYVSALPAEERQAISAYVNLDMLGSPNHIRFVYDEPAAADGSAAITALFAAYFEGAGLAWDSIDLTGKSDHRAFTPAGIATGGLFSGGMEPKTDAQTAAYGGTAGLPADACSHHACDTLTNVSDLPLDEMADALAHAVAVLAQP